MEPIISPWVFYLAELLGDLKLFFAAVGVTDLVYIFINLMATPDGSMPNLHAMKRGVAILVVSTLCFIGLPNTYTVYKMAVANIVTINNVTVEGDGMIKFVEKVAARINWESMSQDWK